MPGSAGVHQSYHCAPCSGFSANDSPACSGSLGRGNQEGHAPQAGAHVSDAENRDAAGQTSHGDGEGATFLLNNIRGLVGFRGRNKVPFLYDLATSRNCLWLAITDTWLNPTILDSELLIHMPGYTVIRQDRHGRIRGGVCLFLRDNLTGEVLCSYSNGVCEVLIVKVYQLDTIVVVLYRPPDTDLCEFTPILNKIDSVLQNLPAPAPNITLMGDLNFPSSVITWQVADGLVLPRVEGHRVPAQPGNGRLVRQQAANLCDLAVKYSLSQQVTEPTREKEILDLIWS